MVLEPINDSRTNAYLRWRENHYRNDILIILRLGSMYLLISNCYGSWSKMLHQMEIFSAGFTNMSIPFLVAKYLWILNVHDSSVHSWFLQPVLINFTFNLRRNKIWVLPVSGSEGFAQYFQLNTLHTHTHTITMVINLVMTKLFFTLNHEWILANVIIKSYCILLSRMLERSKKEK